MNHIAPEGQVWVCAACGKRSRDRYGDQKISYGWDESCMLNAVLCYDPPGLEGWVAVEPQPDLRGSTTSGGGFDF